MGYHCKIGTTVLYVVSNVKKYGGAVSEHICTRQINLFLYI